MGALGKQERREFAIGGDIKCIDVDGKRWTVRVVDMYNPSHEEVESNRAFNDTLGNWDPDREKSTKAVVQLEFTAIDGESFKMYWVPASKQLGPHLSRVGWGRGAFNAIKSELLRWKLP